MSSIKKFSGQIIVRSFEVLVAFAVVFCVAFLWSRIENFSPFQSDPLKKNQRDPESIVQVTGLLNSPDMKAKVAFVRVPIAKLWPTPDESQEPVDHLTYGRQIFINRFESDGRYAHIATAEGVAGFVLVDVLAKDLQLDEAREFSSSNDLDSKKLFKKYLGDARGFYTGAGFTVDFSGGINRSSFSLTRFLQDLSGFKSSSKFEFSNQAFFIGIISSNESAKNSLIHPDLPTFLSGIRATGSGVFIAEDNSLGSSGDAIKRLDRRLFNASFSKDLSAAYLADGLASKTILRGLSLTCEGSNCSISLQTEPEIHLINGLQVLFFDRINKMTPRLTKRIFNPEDPFEIYFVDVDGDEQQDIAFYSNQGFGHPTGKKLLYVAYNQGGVWQMSFVSESQQESNMVAHFEPEPGSFDSPIFVKISGSFGGPLVYTTNGENPKCPLSLKESLFSPSEVELLIQKTTSVKAAVCLDSITEPSVLSAVYVIK